MSLPLPLKQLSEKDQKYIAEFGKDATILSDKDVMMFVKLIDTNRMFYTDGSPKPLCESVADIVKARKPHLAPLVDAYIKDFAAELA